MKRVLIGHRGTGKTSLLERHRMYHPEVPHFDLDDEIEKDVGQNLAEYFTREGESEFRRTEQRVFRQLLAREKKFMIAPGAGFDVSTIPEDFEVILVSRDTDAEGRIFQNRPRLDTDLPPLEEYRRRHQARAAGFAGRANFIYHLPEGQESPDEIERAVLNREFRVSDALYTLTKRDLPALPKLMNCFSRIELRTDLLPGAVIEELLKRHPQHRWLVSLRNSEKLDLRRAREIDADYWYHTDEAGIVSSHVDDIQTGMHQLAELAAQAAGKNAGSLHLKLCPLVETFSDLIAGYRWQQRDPRNRSFLPRSASGRWRWFRQVSKYTQDLNFVRGFNEVADQPSCYEWLALPDAEPALWAAVLGKPVLASRSPREHQEHFAARGTFFTRVELTAEEFTRNLAFLQELGLGYAAVTSPLKAEALTVSAELTAEARGLRAVNTLRARGREFVGHNTDVEGFRALARNVKGSDRVVIWGGGGTLDMIRQVLPQAVPYAARTGQPRGKSTPLTACEYLIWAAPRAPETRFPDASLQVGHVLDLNYSENSMGLEFAAARNIGYTSGLDMFRAQAAAQRKFWSGPEHPAE